VFLSSPETFHAIAFRATQRLFYRGVSNLLEVYPRSGQLTYILKWRILPGVKKQMNRPEPEGHTLMDSTL